MHDIHISVRNLVEFIMRSGDLSTSRTGLKDPDAMQEGTRIHKKLQKRMGSNYHAEVALVQEIPVNCNDIDFTITVEGRADGIFSDETGEVIDEIKGVYRDIHSMKEPLPVHRAQALAYAYIYALQKGLPGMGLRVTYCHIPTEEVRYFTEYLSFEDISAEFLQIVQEYAKWAAWQIQWHETRNLSLKELAFPFPYRDGQANLVKGVYQSILRKKRLYIEAPTGVGKTISTVFPAVKSIGEGITEKIFYLTAKTITRTVAENTFCLLEEHNALLKCITLTAKEKICIQEKAACNPLTCERANGHFDRINEAVFDILTNETIITRDKILQYAQKHTVCPFEMSLDIASWCDVIIGDYNYAFDPTASLKRFFGVEKENDFVFLIDEAHNLVDRAREMYSASLIKEDFLTMKKLTKTKSRKLTNALETCNRSLLELKRECETLQKYNSIQVEAFVLRLMRLCTVLEEFLLQEEHDSSLPLLPAEREQLLNFYFEVRSFQNIYELSDEHYTIYSDYCENGDFCLHLQCMDPSVNLDTYLKKGRCSVFFSATLLPIHYYREQLAGREEDYAIYAPSPFSPAKRLLMIGREVSTKYTRRSPAMYEKIAQYIITFAQSKTGNYLVFFPSYKMMQEIREALLAREHIHDFADTPCSTPALAGGTPHTNPEPADSTLYCDTGHITDMPYTADGHIFLHTQTTSMTEEAREEFLSHFQENPDRTNVGLCVMGGIFSEGIDLKKSRLIGAVIVGTGLPMVCTENELFKDYFDKEKGCGYSYAYQYPGMNKVLQAAGRVIRTTEDIGSILLLDDRFLQSSYQALFPREWFPHDVVTLESMPKYLSRFYRTV